jgi:DNA-directed RNA polymerase specialized sigma24 family protein
VVNEAIDEAIENIVDGAPVDWGRIEHGAGAGAGRGAAWAGDLRIIHDVANFYRLSAYDDYERAIPPTESSTEEPTVELVVGEVQTARYQAALQQLARDDRHAVIGRLELLTSYYDLAAVLGYHYRGTRAAAAAARQAVTRALKRLTIEMGHV